MDADASPQRIYTPEQREEALRLIAELGPMGNPTARSGGARS
ncbi:hypothetical protein BH24ACT24_BH24ACT24_02650 [soil metagenome]